MRDKKVRITGWIFDVYIEKDKAVIWIRTENDKIISLSDEYYPDFYILPNVKNGELIFSSLQREGDVKKIEWVDKHTNLRDQKKKLLYIILNNVNNYMELIKKLRDSGYIEEFFNVDLLHVQRYINTKLGVAPTSKVEVSLNDDKLIEIKRIDDEEEIHPPPFTELYFNINPSNSALTPDSDFDPIASIEVKHHEEEKIFKGEEKSILEDFAYFIQNKDPDFLICPESDAFTFPYLLKRTKILDLNLQLGRKEVKLDFLTKPLPYWIKGRIAVDYDLYGCEIAGVVERSRFSYLPPALALRWRSNRVIDSRLCYELMRRDFVIPKYKGYFEYVRSFKNIIDRDKGGMIIPPIIGKVHENVAELDYESEYPNIIVNYKLSYETVTPKGNIKKKETILPYITESTLKRRLYFKNLRKSFVQGSMERQYCEQRQSSLKLILVCLYGTSGCCWNRFGNVLTFEEINLKSREIMIKTKNLVQSLGYELIYADTDSVFVNKSSSRREDYEHLAGIISNHVHLPIALEHHYKFLIFIPLKSDPSLKMEALKHYFGIAYDGEIVSRGIELRRHDAPKFIKDFQNNLVQTLLCCKNAEEVSTIGYERALQMLGEYVDRVNTGKVELKDLVVSKILRQPIAEYKVTLPHVSAAIQMESRGKRFKKGECIDFIFINTNHKNPLCRVLAYELSSPKIKYDKKKYCNMLLEAAEIILSTFGFSRIMFEKRDKEGFLFN